MTGDSMMEDSDRWALPLLPFQAPNEENREDFRDASTDTDRQNEKDMPHFTIPRKPIMGSASKHVGHVDTRPIKTSTNASRPGSHGSSPRWHSLMSRWWQETLCCLIIAGALLAMVATVYPYRSQPLPQWPYHLSVNSLLSIWTVILKAAMWFILAAGLGQLKWSWYRQTRPLSDIAKYDDASRGRILGTFGLLWLLRGRHLISSLAALVMILSVGMDPFTQQLVRYYTCTQISHLQASIPKTNYYDGGGGDHFRIGATQDTVSQQMQAAINTGIFSPDSTVVPFTCPTGNCTFPTEYFTTGYCSKCVDITDQITISYNVSNNPILFTLPSGLKAIPGWDVMTMGAFEYESEAIVEVILGSIDPNVPNTNDSTDCTSSWTCRGYGAAQCQLFPCVKGYHGIVSEGHLIEEVTSNSSNWGSAFDSSTVNTVDLSCANSAQKAALRQHGYEFDDQTEWLAYNLRVAWSLGGRFCYNSSSDASQTVDCIVPPQCIYTMDGTVVSSLNYWFEQSFFTGNVSAGPETLYGSSLLLRLYNNGEIAFSRVDDTFQNVSTALTNFMRQNGAGNVSSAIVGQALEDETCVHVRWAWMTYPTILGIATIIVLGSMVRETRKMNDFKESIMPLMFNGLDPDLRDRFDLTKMNASDMIEEAKSINVRFAPIDNGWRLKEVTSDT